jgi:hypothetical protein
LQQDDDGKAPVCESVPLKSSSGANPFLQNSAPEDRSPVAVERPPVQPDIVFMDDEIEIVDAELVPEGARESKDILFIE